MATETVPTSPIEGQKPGTSGLRKKTRVVMEGAYLHNFVQATLDAVDAAGKSLVLGGDGRFHNAEAIQVILKMAAANGVSRVWVGQHGLLSTPAVSALIRSLGADGGIILTASHNPAGIDEDWGIKYNTGEGAPAPSSVTDAIYARTLEIGEYKIAAAAADVDLAALGESAVAGMAVEVVDATAHYVEMMRGMFDFAGLRELFARPDFSFVYDALHGVAGPYARALFVDALGADEGCLRHCDPRPDFGGLHADPNLVYASELVATMGLTSTGTALDTDGDGEVPAFGAAADGDGDRNMILGRRFFVSPGDSVAIITHYAGECIPFFADGVQGVARSMPTSAALDHVAEALDIPYFATPTGWKFFCNLMGQHAPFICGEESFGTGSSHVREKDGIWAVLCWLSILRHRNRDAAAPFVGVDAIVREHWATYGRNYYSRHDYEGVDSAAAQELMVRLRGVAALSAASPNGLGVTVGEFTLRAVEEFDYTDPVDGSVARKQGMQLFFADGSRIIFRLSGTGSAGATIRMYLEKYASTSEDLGGETQAALAPLIAVAVQLSGIQELTGREGPTVIT